MLVVPAVSVGANGRLAPGHDVPCGPDVTSYVEDAETVCVASSNASAVQGTNAAFVVYAPQRDGEASGARSPPKKCSSASSKAACGLSSNLATSCPVSLNSTWPASFTTTPDSGS